jgi:hypothetical protein
MTDQPTPKRALTTEEHEARLEKGWVWLGRYPGRRDWDERFERWLGWLRAYQQHIDAGEPTVPLVQEGLL